MPSCRIHCATALTMNSDTHGDRFKSSANGREEIAQSPPTRSFKNPGCSKWLLCAGETIRRTGTSLQVPSRLRKRNDAKASSNHFPSVQNITRVQIKCIIQLTAPIHFVRIICAGVVHPHGFQHEHDVKYSSKDEGEFESSQKIRSNQKSTISTFCDMPCCCWKLA